MGEQTKLITVNETINIYTTADDITRLFGDIVDDYEDVTAEQLEHLKERCLKHDWENWLEFWSLRTR